MRQLHAISSCHASVSMLLMRSPIGRLPCGSIRLSLRAGDPVQPYGSSKHYRFRKRAARIRKSELRRRSSSDVEPRVLLYISFIDACLSVHDHCSHHGNVAKASASSTGACLIPLLMPFARRDAPSVVSDPSRPALLYPSLVCLFAHR